MGFHNLQNLVRDQGVGGSNPLSPTNYSLASSIAYAAFLLFVLALFFGIFGEIGQTFARLRTLSSCPGTSIHHLTTHLRAGRVKRELYDLRSARVSFD